LRSASLCGRSCSRLSGAARVRDPQRRTRRLADEPPRAAEGPTAASPRALT
jgi:hypothetical protein